MIARALAFPAGVKLDGIHHISAITGDAPGNVEFYTGVLGMRMVKRTVNQDEPAVYHLFYGDERGSPGMDLTFFEYPGAAPGVAGGGMVHRIVWRVGSRESLEFWREHLAARGVACRARPDALLFADPEGLAHELVIDETGDRPLTARSPEIPAEHALLGFDGVRAYSAEPLAASGCSARRSGSRAAAARAGRCAATARRHLRLRSAPPEINRRQGAGTVHHVAFAAQFDEIEHWRERIAALGRPPDAGDRTLLLQIRLFPGAERRAVRDRDHRSGLRDR